MGNGSTAFTQNGLNQQLTVGGASAGWDSKGNLTTEPQSGKGYGYSSENLLTSSSGGTAATLAYDPALRLYQVAGAATTRFLYDGSDAIAEYDGANALQRRYVFGPGGDEPLVQYEGTGTTDRRFMSADERGSIISLTDSAGALLNINAYDEYGKPQGTNTGRFQYTGQMWLSELGAYYYKSRVYLPHLGIFAQTDPIGFGGGMNWYAYTGDDPVNATDPSGLLYSIQVCKGGGPNTSDPNGGFTIHGIVCTTVWVWDQVDWSYLFPRSANEYPLGGIGGNGVGRGRQPIKPVCGSPSDGPVRFTVVEATTDPGAGFTIAKGTFTTGSGGQGTFESSGFAVGFELGWARRWGTANNLGTFTGTSDSLSGGFVVFGVPVSFSVSRSQSSGDWYNSLGVGRSSPDVGGSLSTTDTNITSLQCP